MTWCTPHLLILRVAGVLDNLEIRTGFGTAHATTVTRSSDMASLSDCQHRSMAGIAIGDALRNAQNLLLSRVGG